MSFEHPRNWFPVLLSMALFAVAVLVVLGAVQCSRGQGYARSDNFIVYSPPNDQYAASLNGAAETFRREVAEEWLGESLPDGDGRSVVYVDLSTTEDLGLTWAKDDPGRLLHNVWLTTSADRAVGSTLHHEVAHTVFATFRPHPDRLPEWFEEGVATRYDDEGRKEGRAEIVRGWIESGQWPDLRKVIAGPIHSSDVDSYAAANALVEFLLTHYTKPQLTRVADQIEYSAPLQREWRAWVEDNCR